MKNTIIYADTEDNSRELLESGKSGFLKEVTQYAAINEHGDHFHNRGNAVEFFKWLRKQRPCVVYFHNLRYDLGNMFGHALDVPDLLLVGGRIIHAKWDGINFRDSMNIWPMSLDRLGKAFDLAKLEMDVHSKAYVMRDCEIIKCAMEFTRDEVNEFGIERLPATLGGLSIKVWKAMGGDTWFDDEPDSRSAYYGGRVELFQRRVTGDISYVDVNSMYPWAMTQGFPTSNDHQKTIDSTHGIAHVKIKIPKETKVCPLPLRTNDARILYPCGTIEGTWTCAEIRDACRHGSKIQKVDWVKGSRDLECYYSDFVREFYKRRIESKTDAHKLFYKLLLNNLYGQQGMTGEVTRSLNLDRAFDGIPYGSKRLVNRQMPLPSHVNYMHAAHVTAYGRLKLLEGLRAVESERLIYCDTDSIVFEGPSPYTISDKLGEYKLEAKWTHCETIAPKMYQGRTSTGVKIEKAKGVPQRLAGKFIREGSVTFDRPFGLREAIIGYDDGNRKQLSVWQSTTKEMRTQYDKKKLIDNHWHPLFIRS